MNDVTKINESSVAKGKINIDDKIENLYLYEKVRYKRKGFGLIVAILINLIFFSFGPKLISNLIPDNIEHEGWFHFIFVFIWHESVFILVNIYFGIIYLMKHPFFERYKTTSEPWPWEINQEEFMIQLKKTFKQLLFNHLIILPLCLLPNIIFNFSDHNLNKKELPSMLVIMFQVLCCVVSDDFFFYISHRILHHKKLYGKIHKIHHEYKYTIAITSEYAHWIEYLVGNLLSSSIFPMIMNKNMHFVTYIMWITTITIEAADGHSGYDFSFSPHRIIPFNIGAEYHYFHHLTFTGNYASEFSYLDILLNTLNKSYLKYYNNLSNNWNDNRLSVNEKTVIKSDKSS